VVQEAVRHAGLLRDVAHTRAVVPAHGEDPDGGSQDRRPAVCRLVAFACD
jgi:hypothetical protein